MAPMYWLILLFIFSICFIMIIILNYFSITNSSNNNDNKLDHSKKLYKFNWKW
uniref:ATP synthase complex subunit 8 n=1 Tax=Ceratophyllus wui TaxID=2505953 RepID=A0A3R5QP50_9NEOP|nr:ATP synthase F0 subunit 8 [Ceratophyllus wui]QAA12289.1 ATP synthase F0 subunit 8 [Ceratophyllus wui]